MSSGITNEIIRKLERRTIPVEEGGSFRSDGLKSTKLAYEIALEAFKNAIEADGIHKHIAWFQMYVPREIMYAFPNLVPFSIELYSNIAGTMKGVTQYFLELADGCGFSRDICSSIRSQLGAVASDEMPKPSLFLTTGQVCDGCKVIDFIREKTQAPAFIYDSPFYGNDASLKHHIEESQNMIKFIEDVTGEKFEYDLLIEAVNNAKQVYSLWRQLNELRKNIPAPMSARDGMRTLGYASIGGLSSHKTIEYMTSIVNEVKTRVDKGIGYAKNERYRILWCQTAPFYVDLFKYLEEEFGAIVVFDELSQIWFDDSYNSLEPFEFMAAMSMDPWNGPGVNRIKSITEHATEYKVDACIHLNQWGCRISGHMGSMVKDVLQKELGIPTLLLDLDYIDSTEYNEAQVKAKLKAFIETLDKK